MYLSNTLFQLLLAADAVKTLQPPASATKVSSSTTTEENTEVSMELSQVTDLVSETSLKQVDLNTMKCGEVREKKERKCLFELAQKAREIVNSSDFSDSGDELIINEMEVVHWDSEKPLGAAAESQLIPLNLSTYTTSSKNYKDRGKPGNSSSVYKNAISKPKVLKHNRLLSKFKLLKVIDEKATHKTRTKVFRGASCISSTTRQQNHVAFNDSQCFKNQATKSIVSTSEEALLSARKQTNNLLLINDVKLLAKLYNVTHAMFAMTHTPPQPLVSVPLITQVSGLHIPQNWNALPSTLNYPTSEDSRMRMNMKAIVERGMGIPQMESFPCNPLHRTHYPVLCNLLQRSSITNPPNPGTIDMCNNTAVTSNEVISPATFEEIIRGIDHQCKQNLPVIAQHVAARSRKLKQ
jgi:hypothetical protein